MGYTSPRLLPGLLLLPILLCTTPIAAQPPGGSRSVPPATSYRLPSVQQQEEALKQDLQFRLERFPTLHESAKPQARIDIESILFGIFDLNMSTLEAQASSLRVQLQGMKTDPAYQSQTTEIQRLEQSLLQLEQTLAYRRTHRTAIVAQRLRELLGS